MANMKYCQFQNALDDLRDCARTLNDGFDDNSSPEEIKAMKNLIRLCIEIAKNHGPDAVSNALFAIPEKDRRVT